MMDKLATRDNRINKWFKPQIDQSKRRDRVEIFMINIIMIEEIIKIGSEQIEVDLGMNKIIWMIIGEEILEVMWECINILEDIIVEGDTEEIIGMKIITEKEVRNRSRERFFGQ